MPYAHVELFYADEDGNEVRVLPGEEVDPAALDGGDRLVDEGAIKDEPYDPAAAPVLTPDYVDIDGVRYIKSGDAANTGDASNEG